MSTYYDIINAKNVERIRELIELSTVFHKKRGICIRNLCAI